MSEYRIPLYVIIDVSERKKNLWYNKNYHNITERGFICTTARNYSERIKEIELRITEATQIYKLTIRYRPGLKSLINF